MQIRSFGALGIAAPVVLMAVGMAVPATADIVIYNGGTPDQGGQIYGQVPTSLAMSFILSSSSTVTDANWWGGCFPSVTCGSFPDFAIGIFTDSSGLPGFPLFIVDAGSANQTATGNLIGGQWDEYAYSATFSPVSLSAGTTYWFALTEIVPEDIWGWETTSSAPSGAMLVAGSPDGTINLPETLAFQLTGPAASTPEPASLALLGTAVAGLGFFLMRRRKRS